MESVAPAIVKKRFVELLSYIKDFLSFLCSSLCKVKVVALTIAAEVYGTVFRNCTPAQRPNENPTQDTHLRCPFRAGEVDHEEAREADLLQHVTTATLLLDGHLQHRVGAG